MRSKQPPRYFGLAYRSASGTPDSLAPRPGVDDGLDGGLSFFSSLGNPHVRVGRYVEVDTSQLTQLVAILDDDPEGHISIRPMDMNTLQAWASSRGTGNIHTYTQEILGAVTYIGKKLSEEH